MDMPKFASRDSLTKLWWLHDSFWHSAMVKEMGLARANQINLEVAERIFRMMANQLLREKVIERPGSIRDLMAIFKVVWRNAFFDDLYIKDPISYNGNTAVWIGSQCHAYESIKKANMLDSYACGCPSVRNGVMKALRLKPLHEIKESLVAGDKRCVVEITFAPEKS